MTIKKYQREYSVKEGVFVIAFGVIGVGFSILIGYAVYIAIHFLMKV